MCVWAESSMCVWGFLNECMFIFNNLQFCQGRVLFGLLFAMLNCRENFNMHSGHPSLPPLSEKARHLIHYHKIRGKFHFTLQLIPFLLHSI